MLFRTWSLPVQVPLLRIQAVFFRRSLNAHLLKNCIGECKNVAKLVDFHKIEFCSLITGT